MKTVFFFKIRKMTVSCLFQVLVQSFRVASNENEAKKIPQEFPCPEYVIKAQVLAGGRGKVMESFEAVK